jgi:hypothetical protein
MKMIKILTVLSLGLVCVMPTHAQTQNRLDRRQQRVEVQKEYSDIFALVERGLSEANVGVFSRYFSHQVYVSLPSGERGYFSSNQAHAILQNYVGSRQSQSVRFTTFGEAENIPYATGPGRFVTRSGVETVQIYVALARIGEQWMLSHVSIY